MARLLTGKPSSTNALVNSSLFGQVTTVFGSGGTVGVGVSRGLAKEGSTLILPYRQGSARSDHRQVSTVATDKNTFHPMMIDLHRPAQIRQMIEPADYVVCCLGRHQSSNSLLRLHDLYTGFDPVIRQIPVDIAKAAKEMGKQMVYFSRIGAHLESESSILRAHAQAELELREVMPEIIIIRPSDVFSYQGNLDSDLIRKIGYRIHRGSMPCYNEMLSRVSQPVCSTDLGHAAAAALEDPSRWGKTYELGGRQRVTVEDLIKYVCTQCNAPANIRLMNFHVAKLFGAVMSRLKFMETTDAEFFRRMQYNAIPNEHNLPDIYGWEDLGIDKRSLLLIEEVCPESLSPYDWKGRGKATQFVEQNILSVM